MIGFWYPNTSRALALASCRYRIANPLEGAGTEKAMVVFGPGFPGEILGRGAACVVLRPFLAGRILAKVRRLKSAGVRLIADFDDLLFGGDPALYPLVLAGRRSRRQLSKQQQTYRQGLQWFDGFSVATRPLAEEMKEAVPDRPVTVVPNLPSRSWIEQGRLLYPLWKPGDERVIRYLSGSPSHDADFESIRPVLERFLRDNPDVRLEIVGHLNCKMSAAKQGQVLFGPAVPFDHIPRYLASSWVTLAPLLDTPFCRCKSGVKFLESAAFGCPCIATPVPDIRTHLEGGVLCADRAETWRQHLETLLNDDYRMKLGEQGRAYVDGLAGAGRSWSCLREATAG